jgi:hypothetical protein
MLSVREVERVEEGDLDILSIWYESNLLREGERNLGTEHSGLGGNVIYPLRNNQKTNSAEIAEDAE